MAMSIEEDVSDRGHDTEYPGVIQNKNVRFAGTDAGGNLPEAVSEDAELRIEKE